MVVATPEELVRQGVIRHMIQQLGYPASLIVVEKELSALPHLALSPTKLPLRRADILCFAKGIHPEHALYPLLLIECKATPITSRVWSQVIGYNHFIGAYFISVANGAHIRTGWVDSATGDYQHVNFLPSYTELLKHTFST